MRHIWKVLVACILLGCEPTKFDSEVVLPKLFSDGMVIQRDRPISVWGKGIPGKNIRVSMGGSVGSVQVEEDSTWIVKLPSGKVGGPHVLQVNHTKIKDVYVGDVWLAGGQSNMEWPLRAGVIGADAEIEAGGLPQIRFFKVPNSYSALVKEDVVGGSWKVADRDNLPGFSAIAWFFAKRNHLDKQVPVGIIESNWGGTPAEGWTDLKTLAEMERSFSEEAREILENREKWENETQANEKRREERDLLVGKPDSVTAATVSALGYDDSKWTKVDLPGGNPLSHIAWIRKKFSLNTVSGVTLHLPAIDQMAYLYVNGKPLHYKDWSSGMPDLVIPEDLLVSGQNVITIRAVNTWNNQPRVGTPGEMYLEQQGKKIALEGKWSYSNNKVEQELPVVESYNWKPAMMYNAMIAPLTKYPIKGVIWYQGESNTGRHEEYRKLFSGMITSWRAAWNLGDFPFLFVQLANFMERKDVQPESGWAYLREAQAQTLQLPNTGMAVAIDLGDADDIHPRNKKDVGERLWLQARKIAYGEKDVVASGPVFSSGEIKGNQLYLKFEAVGEGMKLSNGDEVKGFILADQTGKFNTVQATLLDGNTVGVAIPSGVESGEIRYAWADNPDVNLVNSEGLPAVPFRYGF